MQGTLRAKMSLQRNQGKPEDPKTSRLSNSNKSGIFELVISL